MKMTPEHYEDLKQRVALFAGEVPDHRKRLANDPRVKDIEHRLRCDVLHATKILDAYSYQEFDYTDAQIDTAMRKVFKELDLALK